MFDAVRYFAVGAQLVVLLLMHGYSLIPLLPGASSRSCCGASSHDASSCGCSPEKIAGHTCCCSSIARSASSAPCCEAGNSVAKHSKERPEQTYLCLLPCSGQSPWDDLLDNDHVYTPYSGMPLPTMRPAEARFSLAAVTVPNHFIEPAEPPPKQHSPLQQTIWRS